MSMPQPDRGHAPALGRYLVLSLTLVIVGASDAYLAATMTSRGEIVGRPFFDVFPHNPAAADATGKQNLEASLQRVLASGRPDSILQRHDIRRPDGVFEERHWLATNTPILGRQEEIVSIIRHVEDVTAHVHPFQEELRETTGRAERVEALLADANARLRLTLAAGEIGTWLWDSVHNRVVADANLARMFSVSEEEARGGPIEAYTRAIHPDDRARVEQTIAESLSQRMAYEAEYRLVSPDGSVRWVLARGRVERDADGEAVGLPGVVLDITARVRADQAWLELTEKLAQQALIFDTTLSSITDFAYMFDRQGRFAYVNKALLDLWDLTLAEAVGKNFFELKYPDELAAKLQAQIQFVFDTGQTVRDETPYTSPTGAGGYYEYIFSPVKDSDGAITVVAGSTRDITARKAVEAERERLQEENSQLLQAERAARAEAERLGLAKDEFLATLSHELRTPLNAMLGWAQLIRRRGHDARTVDEGLTVIERNAQLQRQLIEDLLDMSRIVSGKVRLDVQRIDLGTIVEAALLSARPAADAKQLKVTTVLDRGSATLWGDPNRLQQAIWNLLTNAIKFTPKGGRIEVIQRRNGSTIELSVQDTGRASTPDSCPMSSSASDNRTRRPLGCTAASAWAWRSSRRWWNSTVDECPRQALDWDMAQRSPFACPSRSAIPAHWRPYTATLLAPHVGVGRIGYSTGPAGRSQSPGRGR